MRRPALLAILVAIAVVGAAVRPAAADEDSGARSSYWSVSLLGGALVPLPPMNEDHQIGLVAGLRTGWTSKLGLGLGLAADYSPLPRRTADGVTYETHYGTVTAGPHWTIGHDTVRLTIGGGGGVALEQTTARGATVERSRRAVPAAVGEVVLELHVIGGGGFLLGGGAGFTFGDDPYRYAYGLGGLTLTF